MDDTLVSEDMIFKANHNLFKVFFYLNLLNIIYSLVQLQLKETIQSNPIQSNE